MLGTLKSNAALVIGYLGDHAHRRFVATVAALVLTHILGKAFDAESISQGIEIVIGGIGGAWSSTTPKVADAS